MERMEATIYWENLSFWPYWHGIVFSVTDGGRRWVGTTGGTADPEACMRETLALMTAGSEQQDQQDA